MREFRRTFIPRPPQGAPRGAPGSASAVYPGKEAVPATPTSLPPCAPGDVACLVQRARRIPHEPGVYRWLGADGKTLYVGKAIDLSARVRSYLSSSHDAKTERLMELACDVVYIATHTEKEAFILEHNLIKQDRPPFNVLLTDDKRYPYIMVTNEEYPRVVYTRDLDVPGATYFGPFPDAFAAQGITRLLNRAFGLRVCRTLPKKACIYHQIGACLAPCIKAVPDEEYAAAADSARSFLKGRGKQLAAELERRMRDAGDAMRFEEAARMRDTRDAILSVLERQRVFGDGKLDQDAVGLFRRGDRACATLLFVRGGKVVGREDHFLSHATEAADSEVVGAFLSQYYGTALQVPRELLLPAAPPDAAPLEAWLRERRGGAVTFTVPERGDKKRLLDMATKNAELLMAEDHFKREREAGHGVDDLQKLLGLERAPETIEGFDISHHGGTLTVASMVRFLHGLAHKQMYRHYRIREATGGDDYLAMKEAVRRRFEGLAERGEEFPDLVLIDGGRGQLAAALDALKGLGIDWQPVVALAKREEEIWLPDRLHPVTAPAHHEGRQLLERVRNEAHRFAVRYQDTLKRGRTKSALLDVPGIGPKRMRLLLRTFGSVRALAGAEVEAVMAVPGVTRETAEAIIQAARRNAGARAG